MICVVPRRKVLHDAAALEDADRFAVGEFVRDGWDTVALSRQTYRGPTVYQAYRPLGLISRNHGSFCVLFENSILVVL